MRKEIVLFVLWHKNIWSMRQIFEEPCGGTLHRPDNHEIWEREPQGQILNNWVKPLFCASENGASFRFYFPTHVEHVIF
jgi:hypothetical protein